MRAYRGHTEGKNFVWKIYCFFPLNLRVLPADSDGNICKKWMQNALRFVMKNRSFSSLINNFKIRIKSYLSKRKNFYFSSEIWGRFAFTFCRYFHQNLQVLPSESVAGNTLRFRGKKQYIFQTKFFPLEFEGISYNSVHHDYQSGALVHSATQLFAFRERRLGLVKMFNDKPLLISVGRLQLSYCKVRGEEYFLMPCLRK